MLELRLLGSFAGLMAGAPLPHIPTARVQALLCILAVEQGYPFPRERLMTLLWPDMPLSSAQQNLRQTLYLLRKVLESQPGSPPVLAADRLTVSLNPDIPCWLDVAHFSTYTGPHRTPDEWQQGVALYRGAFLADFFLGDSDLFEEWAATKRAWLHNRVLDTLERLAESYLRRGDTRLAMAAAQQHLALDPLREQAHRQLMMALSLAGQRGAALTQYERCCALLQRELGVPPSPETIALATALRSGAHDDNPAARVAVEMVAPAIVERLDGVPSVIADYLATGLPLLGRDAELAALDRLFGQEGAQLVTVVGVGGIGKTHLAIGWAARQFTAYPDGVSFVNLAPLTQPHELAPALAAALELPRGQRAHEARTVEEQIIGFLRNKRLLLLLDNFEHLRGSEPFLNTLLQAAPVLHLLVTSRVRLSLRSQRLLHLEGLPTPTDDGNIRDTAAGRLFERAAQRSAAGYTIMEDEGPALAQLCRRVAGLPLAIELAASWVDTLPLPVINQEVSRSLDLLETDAIDIDPRHRSLRAVFLKSWQLLAHDEQLILAQLAVFPASFDGNALHAVARMQDGQPVHPQSLARLTNSSLLRFDPHGRRYTLHEVVRQYAQEMLPSVHADALARHADHYAGVLASAAETIKRGQWDAGLDAIEAEFDHVTDAWSWQVAHGTLRRLGEIVDGMAIYYERRRHYADGYRLLQVLVDRLLRSEDPSDPQVMRLLARTYAWQAPFDADTTRAAATLYTAEAALASLLEQDVDVRGDLALVKLCLGIVLQYERSAPFALRESLVLYQAIQDDHGMVLSSFRLGIALDYCGIYDGSVQMLETARNLSIRRGSVEEEARICMALSGILASLGEFAYSREIAGVALGKLKNAKTADARLNRLILQAATIEGDFARLIGINEQISCIAEYAGHDRDNGVNLVQRAMLSLHAGRYDCVLPLLDRGTALLQRTEPNGEGFSLFVPQVCAIHAFSQGDLVRADRLEADVIERYRQLDDAAGIPGPLVFRAHHARAMGAPTEARRHLMESLTLLTAHFNVIPTTEWLLVCSLLLIDEGDLPRAATLYSLAQRGAWPGSKLYRDLAGQAIEDALATLPEAVRADAEQQVAHLSLRTAIPLLFAEFAARWPEQAADLGINSVEGS